jgi:hypothetical protein
MKNLETIILIDKLHIISLLLKFMKNVKLNELKKIKIIKK